MNRETQFIFEVWDVVRDHISVNKRADVAESILRAAVDYGFESSDLASIVDEDDDLKEAYNLVFEDEIEDEDDD